MVRSGREGWSGMMSSVNAKQQCGSRKQAEKRHDRDQKEGGCHTAGPLPIPPALLPCYSGLFLNLMVGSHAKGKPSKQNREIGVLFWKAFCPGSGWLHISPSTDSLLGLTKMTKSFGTVLRDNCPWAGLWSNMMSVCLCLQCFPFGGRWEYCSDGTEAKI